MTRDEAEAWCRKHGIEFYSFQTRKTGYENGPPKSGGETMWDVFGFVWKKNRSDKVRVRALGPDLVECVQRVKDSYKAIAGAE